MPAPRTLPRPFPAAPPGVLHPRSAPAGTTFRNTLAALASGTTLTQGAGGNTGGGSGQFFDGVQTGPGSTLASDNSIAPHGGNSLKCATAATPTTVFAAWSGSFSSPAATWSSFSFYADSLPGAATRIWGAYTSGGALCGQIQLATSGVLSIKNAAGGTLGTSATVLSSATWYRLEPYIFGDSANGVLALRVYTALDGYTPSETLYGSGAALTGPPGSWRFGISGLNVASVSLHYGDIALSSAGAIGPAVTLVTFPFPADPSTGATDSGTLTETATVAVSDPDAFTGTDAGEALTAQASPGDSATAAEGSPLIAVASADTASFTEAASLLQSSADSFTGTEGGDSQIVTVSADAATAADTLTSLRLQAADTATGTEQPPSVAVASAETASAADSAVLRLPGTETGSFADAGTVATVETISSADTASFTEAAGAALTSADTATALETASLRLTAADSAAAAEAASLTVPAADTGSFAEAAALRLTSADTGAAAEAASLAVTAPETGTGTEAAALGIASAETMTMLETALLELADTDAATAADYGFQSGPIGPDGDTGSFADAEIAPLTVQVLILAMDVSTQVTGVQVVTVVQDRP